MKTASSSFAALIVALGLGSVSSRTHAAELTWDAPPGCPDLDALRWKIEQSLGTTLEQAAPLRFSAKVEAKSSRRWVVILDVANTTKPDEPQRRALEATSCDEAAQALRVAITLALGADAVSVPPGPAGTNAPEPESPPTAAVPQPTSRASAETTTRKAPQAALNYWFAAQLGPLLNAGSLPGIAPGVRVSALGGMRAFAVQLGALVLPDRTKHTTEEPSGTFTLIAATASVCGVADAAAARVRLCAGSELGKLSGRGYNTSHSWTGSSGWVAPFVELGASWPLLGDSLRFFGVGTVAMPLIRKQFSVDNFGQVHQPAVLIGQLGAGLELLWQ
jgi:hypothetical protein